MENLRYPIVRKEPNSDTSYTTHIPVLYIKSTRGERAYSCPTSNNGHTQADKNTSLYSLTVCSLRLSSPVSTLHSLLPSLYTVNRLHRKKHANLQVLPPGLDSSNRVADKFR